MKDKHEQLAFSIGRKSTLAVVALWLLFGSLGVHRMYLNKVASGAVMAILTISGLLTLTIGIGLIFLIAVLIWWLLDLVMIFFAVRRQNKLHDRIYGNL